VAPLPGASWHGRRAEMFQAMYTVCGKRCGQHGASRGRTVDGHGENAQLHKSEPAAPGVPMGQRTARTGL